MPEFHPFYEEKKEFTINTPIYKYKFLLKSLLNFT